MSNMNNGELLLSPRLEQASHMLLRIGIVAFAVTGVVETLLDVDQEQCCRHLPVIARLERIAAGGEQRYP